MSRPRVAADVLPGDVLRLDRSLVGASLLFLAGVAVGLLVAPPRLPLALAAAGLLAASAAVRGGGPRRVPLMLAFVVAGAWCGSLTARPPAGDHVVHQVGERRESVRVVGIVISDPVTRDPTARRTRRRTFRLRLDALEHNGSPRSCSGVLDVRMELAAGQEPPVYGDRWRLNGLLSLHADPGRQAPGGEAGSLRVWAGGGRRLSGLGPQVHKPIERLRTNRTHRFDHGRVPCQRSAVSGQPRSRQLAVLIPSPFVRR